MENIRLDAVMYERGMCKSRERARQLIKNGMVTVNGKVCTKPAYSVSDETIIEVTGDIHRYVGRGGLKLEKAMQVFPITLDGAICMDIGASTGGFTDCMLQNGAVKVYAVDVGHGQLDWKLRNDERVVCMEKTNFRYLQPSDIADPIDFASCDVSFISLTKILLPARAILKDEGRMVCLIKPQFEAGKDKVGKKGVVRDKSVHREVVEKIIKFATICGFEILRLDFSPIKGPEGNIEYLIYLKKDASLNDAVAELDEKSAEEILKQTDEITGVSIEDIKNIVEKAHEGLDNEDISDNN